MKFLNLKKKKDKRGEGPHNTFSGVMHPMSPSLLIITFSSLSLFDPFKARGQKRKKINSSLPQSFRPMAEGKKKTTVHAGSMEFWILFNLSFPTFPSNQTMEINFFSSYFFPLPFHFFLNHSNQTHPYSVTY